MTFNVKRSLLNPKFDGYKLSSISDRDCVSTISLPAQGLSQSTVSAKSHLYFQEVQSRVRHNHLAVAIDSAASDPIATFAYIDKERVFTSVLIDQVRKMVSLYLITLSDTYYGVCIGITSSSISPPLWTSGKRAIRAQGLSTRKRVPGINITR